MHQSPIKKAASSKQQIKQAMRPVPTKVQIHHIATCWRRSLGLPATTHCALLTVGCLICRSACCGCLLWLFAGASARGGGWYAWGVEEEGPWWVVCLLWLDASCMWYGRCGLCLLWLLDVAACWLLAMPGCLLWLLDGGWLWL